MSLLTIFGAGQIAGLRAPGEQLTSDVSAAGMTAYVVTNISEYWFQLLATDQGVPLAVVPPWSVAQGMIAQPTQNVTLQSNTQLPTVPLSSPNQTAQQQVLLELGAGEIAPQVISLSVASASQVTIAGNAMVQWNQSGPVTIENTVSAPGVVEQAIGEFGASLTSGLVVINTSSAYTLLTAGTPAYIRVIVLTVWNRSNTQWGAVEVYFASTPATVLANFMVPPIGTAGYCQNLVIVFPDAVAFTDNLVADILDPQGTYSVGIAATVEGVQSAASPVTATH